MKHIADGVYFFNLKRAQKLGACQYAQGCWEGMFGPRDVLITFDVMLSMQEKASSVYWCAEKMLKEALVPRSEWYDFQHNYCQVHTYAEEVQIFMDLLAKRARREGRLP